MKITKYQFKYIFILILLAQSGCGFGTLFPTSDVPCVVPTKWSKTSNTLFVRSENGNPDVLLFMHQSIVQHDIDKEDGRIDFQPHDPIYRYDRTTNSIDVVEDSVWDNDNSEITNCLRFSGRFSPFTLSPQPENKLLYNEQQVSVAGGTFLRLLPAPFSQGAIANAVAVLSTDGFIPTTFFFLPGNRSTGQHFHQLFSEIDGQLLGTPLRLGVGGPNQRIVTICWTLDKKYVLYLENAGFDGGYSKICIVDVEDEIQSVLEVME